MKKVLLGMAIFVAVTSCNSSNSSGNDNEAADTSQVGSNNSLSTDSTTAHPDGMINGSVISSDTAAMNTQNAINKAKEAQK